MVYTNIEDIPYPFLYKVAKAIAQKYDFKSIYMDNHGGDIDLVLKGKLSETMIKDILQLFPHKNSIELEYFLHYSYSDDMQYTYVYPPDGIDYRTLKTA